MPHDHSHDPGNRLILRVGEIASDAAGLDDRTRLWCRFVRAGTVRAAGNRDSKIVIDPHALETAAAAGKFNQRAVFVDHAGWFDYPSLTKLAGVTSGAVWNPLEQTVEGEIMLNVSQTGLLIEELISEMLSYPDNSPDIGLSIVFYPVWDRDAEDGLSHITGIEHVESVDFVFEPAADGRVLQALSRASCGALSSYALGQAAEHPSGISKPDNSENNQGENGMPDKKLVLNEVMDLNPNVEEVQLTPAGTSPGADDNQRTVDPAPALNPAEEVDQWVFAAREAAITQMIEASGLPEASRIRLLSLHYDSPSEVVRQIAAERTYLAQLQEDTTINIGGIPPRSPGISNMLTSLDRIEQAAEALLAGVRPPAGVPPLSGIRELYHLLSGDYELNGVFQPDRISLANVNSSTMSNLVANVLNKRVINEFAMYPQWWLPIVSEEDFATLQAVRWITLGGVGELPTVAEGAAYTELTWDDTYETASFTKKGGYLGLTIEAIDKDDTGVIRAAPRALAQAAWLTLSKAVSSIFTANSGLGPTMSDSVALFDASHSNLGTTALSWSEYVVVRTAMRKQTEVHSSERLGALTAPRYILVPPDLEITALQILASEGQPGTANNDVNPLADGGEFSARMAAARDRVIVVDLWTDTNNWAAVCDPRLYPTIGIGYRYGRTPEIFSVASPTARLMFTNDTMPIKVRFFYAVGPMDYRGMYKENVA